MKSKTLFSMQDISRLMNSQRIASYGFMFLACLFCLPITALLADDLPQLDEFTFTSTLDDSTQPALIWVPQAERDRQVPMLVFLHSWSHGYEQNNADWQKQTIERGWVYLHPHFRGRNDKPEACGSPLARRDILDSMQSVINKYNIDTSRIYLAGRSGGGHMAMLMAGHHPDRFSAVSSWVGISNLIDWYDFHTRDGEPTNYARMALKVFGGPPGTSKEIDAAFRDRSPIFHLRHAVDLPLDIHAGIHDGHTGSVPINQSLNAFNKIARANNDEPISDERINRLLQPRKRMADPSNTDETVDYPREIHFRNTSGKARITIFEGGHEGLAKPATEWLSQKQRETVWKRTRTYSGVE